MEDPENDHDHHQKKPSSNSKLKSIRKLKIKLKIINPKDDHHPEEDQAGDHDDHQFQESGSDSAQNYTQADKKQEEVKGSSSSSSTSSENNHQLIMRTSARVRVRVRVCPICQKEFPTGKALGGHMRAHALGSVSGQVHPPKPGSGSGFGCTLCGKEFWSKKSLFGHMRSHPDRLWRGMQSPPELQIGPDPGLGRARALELPSWGKKGKRGQPEGLGKSSPESAEVEKSKRVCMYDPDELYFLQNLGFFLGKNDKIISHNHGGGPEKEVEKTGDPARTRVDPGLKEKKKVMGDEKKINGNGKRVIRDNLGCMGKEEDDDEDERGIRLKCGTCNNKTFPTPQALGGHMSSHTKEKNYHNFLGSFSCVGPADNGICVDSYTGLGTVQVESRRHVCGNVDFRGKEVVVKGSEDKEKFMSNNHNFLDNSNHVGSTDSGICVDSYTSFGKARVGSSRHVGGIIDFREKKVVVKESEDNKKSISNNHNFLGNFNHVGPDDNGIRVDSYTRLGIASVGSSRHVGGNIEFHEKEVAVNDSENNEKFISNHGKCHHFPSSFDQSNSDRPGQNVQVFELDLNITPPAIEEEDIIVDSHDPHSLKFL